MSDHLDTATWEPLVDAAIRGAGRRYGFGLDELEDFASHVKLRMLENDCRILRSFEGKSKFSTYLTAVVINLARDYCNRKWGKWRPSAEALRSGPVAVRLEILLYRDGYTLHEATEILLSRHDFDTSAEEIAELAARLPTRRPRIFIGEDGLRVLASPDRADAGVRETERTELLEKASSALQRALALLDPSDRLILRLYFIEGITVADIARSYKVEQRPLYSRIYNARDTLRAALERVGVDAAAVLDATGWGDGELGLDFGEGDGGGDELQKRFGVGPSQEVESEERTSEEVT